MPNILPSTPARVAALVVSLEAVALLALAGGYLIGIERQAEDSAGRTIASIALFLVGAVILASMARGWLRGQAWPRMATLVLNALMVPVALSSLRAWGWLVGVPVLLVSVTGVAASLLAGEPDPAAGRADSQG